jgi:hypothetical protein
MFFLKRLSQNEWNGILHWGEKTKTVALSHLIENFEKKEEGESVHIYYE